MKKTILAFITFLILLLFMGWKSGQLFLEKDTRATTVIDTPSSLLTASRTINPTKSLSPTIELTHTKYLSFTPSLSVTPDYSKQTQEAYWETAYVVGLTSTIDVEYTVEAAVATMNTKDLNCEDGQYRGMDWGVNIETDNYITKSDTWTLMSCVLWYDYDPEIIAPDFTKVVNRNNTKVYTILHNDLQLPRSFYLEVIHVDSNRELMYLTWDVSGDRDGFFEKSYFGYGKSIYQLDLQTGDLNTLLPWPDNVDYFDLDFSPDFETMAFATSEDPHIVKLMHTTNGQIYHTVDLGDDITYLGAFTWTRDNKYLIYAAGHDGWETIHNGVSIYRLNLKTMENVEIIKNDMRMMVPYSARKFPQSIVDNNILKLQSIDYMNYFYDYARNYWEMNILTGEVSSLPDDGDW